MALTEQELEELGTLQQSFDHRQIFLRAQERGKVRKIPMKYNPEGAEYALLSQDLASLDEPDLRRYFSLLEQNRVTGFCMSSLYGGEGQSFVIERNVPLELQPFVALHEIQETTVTPIIHNSNRDHMYLAEERGEKFEHPQEPEEEAHCWACEVELRELFSKGRELAIKYAQWLPNEYFTNADSNFFNKRDRAKISPLELVLELIDTITIERREGWIKEFPWLEEVA